MKSLFLKDLLTVEKGGRYYLAFIVMYWVIGVFSKSISTFSTIVVVICTMLPINMMSFDERAGFDGFSRTLPVQTRALVGAKYMLGLFFSGFGVALVFLGNLVLKMGLVANFSAVLLNWATALLCLTFYMPIMFKFGVDKGRIVMICSMVLIPVVVLGSALLYFKDLPTSSPELVPAAFILPLLLITAVVLVVSFHLSVYFYSKRDF